MKLIKPSYEILKKPEDLLEVFRFVERIGRVCWKSEDKITDDSWIRFVKSLCDKKHLSVLEHGTICIKVDSQLFNVETFPKSNTYLDSIIESKFSRVDYNAHGAKIYTNLRVIYENNKDLFNKLFEIAETNNFAMILPGYITVIPGDGITVFFNCCRGVSHEFVRHRVFSFTQSSTRYCNYSHDKFGNEITFIKPCWDYSQTLRSFNGNHAESFVTALYLAEETYMHLLDIGWQPQQAREVLPNALATELVMTGNPEQWKGFFKLRDDSAAHLQARELAEPLHKEMINNKLVIYPPKLKKFKFVGNNWGHWDIYYDEIIEAETKEKAEDMFYNRGYAELADRNNGNMNVNCDDSNIKITEIEDDSND